MPLSAIVCDSSSFRFFANAKHALFGNIYHTKYCYEFQMTLIVALYVIHA